VRKKTQDDNSVLKNGFFFSLINNYIVDLFNKMFC